MLWRGGAAARVGRVGIIYLAAALGSPSGGWGVDAASREPGPPAAPECTEEQVRVMLLGTFHFAQTDAVDILEPRRQEELARILDELERFAPEVVAVEYPYGKQERLDENWAVFMKAADPGSLRSRNEIFQVGFRLARRLGLVGVAAVDVPMNLWHDSIRVFDESYPGARDRLRERWEIESGPGVGPDDDLTLAGILAAYNRDDARPNRELYGRFLPLVEGNLYAGALKLRPWYDRNLRIVQNLFRHSDPEMRRLVLVVGAGHLRVLEQILELTPQLCPVDPGPYLEAAAAAGG